MNEEKNINANDNDENNLLIAIIIISALIVGFSIFSRIYHPIDPESRFPTGELVDGGADASIYTWHDLNGNGIVEPGEPPFPRVEIQHPYDEHPYTDKNGRIDTSEFIPGCNWNCWVGCYVEVIPPEGYLPTTPIRQELTGDFLLYSFGFIAESP